MYVVTKLATTDIGLCISRDRHQLLFLNQTNQYMIFQRLFALLFYLAHLENLYRKLSVKSFKYNQLYLALCIQTN